jgi:hypothetical protein
MMKRHGWVLLIVLVLAGVLFSAVSFASARQSMRETTQSEWTTLFSDTFTTTLSVWTIGHEGAAGYEWGVVPYVWEGTPGHGLWAAGGGDLGQNQEWASGTYTNGMSTLAVAGPFTLTQDVVDLRLTARVLNASLPGDSLYLAFSRDGVEPISWGSPVATSGSAWQTEVRFTGALDAGERVWVFILFQSGQTGLAQGPLIDSVTVEARIQYGAYLPLIRLDPTPTPIPHFYDDFTDPASGWFVGWAQRYNVYTDRRGVYHEGLEDVAEMLYRDGTYQIQIPLTWHGWGDVDTWFVWPAEMAPLPSSAYPLPQNYCIELTGRIPKTWSPDSEGGAELQAPDLSHWGIVFGANEARSELYTFQINNRGNIGIVGFHNYIYPGGRDESTPDNAEWPIYLWPDNQPEYWSKKSFAWPSDVFRTLKVHVQGDRADFFLNGEKIATANIPGMPRARVGLIGGDYEITPTFIEFASFYYDPLCTP